VRQRSVVSLLTCTVLLIACATEQPPPPERVAELDARQAPEVRFGKRLNLLSESPARVVGVISRDGRAHVWAIGPSKTLHHIEVDASGNVSSERIGAVDENLATMAFDAVESRPGALRVLAGSSQFVRGTAGTGWQEVKGNQCVRFLAIAEVLYCGLVMSGEELGAPKRADWYAGVFVIIPYAIPVQRQSRKLVIAEASGDTWVARTIVDVDDPLDAQPKFLMGADSGGNVHLVYAVGRGGALLLFAPPGIGGAVPQAVLRYARVNSESLLPRVTAPGGEPIKPFALVSGHSITAPTDLYGGMSTSALANSASFAFDPASGVLEGLVATVGGGQRGTGWRSGKAGFKGVFDVHLRSGKWDDHADVVLLNDWPTEGLDYVFPSGRPSVAFDSSGGLHALVPLCTEHPIWDPCKGAFSYLVKRGRRWSKPVMVKAPFDFHQDRWGQTLLLVGEARSFAAWAEARAGLVGRWILPGETDAR